MKVIKKMNRRDLLGFMGKAGIAAAGVAILGSCKGGPTTPDPPPPPPPPPVQSTVLVKFYNHTQGYLGEKTYTCMSDTVLLIRVSDCPDTSTVDASRIAVREGINNGWIGKLVGYSNTGQLNSAKFPTQDSEYDAFLMNNTNGADYGILESATYYLGLMHSPNATWDREDYASGPDEIPHEAMRQIKESLVFPWAKYMDFTELQPGVRGHFWVGYAPGPDPLAGVRCGFSESSAWVNPAVCTTDILKLKGLIESIVGHLTMCYNPGQSVLKYELITDDNGINAIGKDLLAYSLVRDGWRYGSGL